MHYVGNLLYFFLGGGIILGPLWLVVSALCALSVVLLPIAPATCRIANFACFPFGKELVRSSDLDGTERSALVGTVGVLWVLFFGWWLFLTYTMLGLAQCLTIIGIPFGIANVKIGKASLNPVGKRIVDRYQYEILRRERAQSKIDARRSRAGSRRPATGRRERAPAPHSDDAIGDAEVLEPDPR